MIVASRIPALTERLRAATIKAAEEQQPVAGQTATVIEQIPDHGKVLPEQRAA
jgi:hypothetical protein